MVRNSKMAIAGAVLLAASVVPTVVGCKSGGEDYSSKDAQFATTNTSTFSAAGSTFIAPLFTRWGNDYEKTHHITVNYRPIGSGGGLNELKQGLITFAASDAPLTENQMKTLPPIVQIPVTAGPVCIVANLPNFSGSLKLSGKTLADIYEGKIRNWDDPSISRDNPGTKLPSLPILPIHRLDGSGTTSIFTSYLSAVSPSWAANPGHGMTVAWQAGIGQAGSKGVLSMVQRSVGAIGYLELNYAKDAGLPIASIQNKAGEFVAPSGSSATLAVNAFEDALSKDPSTPVVDPPATAKGAYPITGLSFIVIPKENKTPGEQQKFKEFITYCLTDGQSAAADMSYVKLPAPVIAQGKDMLSQLTEGGKPLT